MHGHLYTSANNQITEW